MSVMRDVSRASHELRRSESKKAKLDRVCYGFMTGSNEVGVSRKSGVYYIIDEDCHKRYSFSNSMEADLFSVDVPAAVLGYDLVLTDDLIATSSVGQKHFGSL